MATWHLRLFTLSATIFAIGACDPGGHIGRRAPPTIRLATTLVEFGQVPVEQVVTSSITISNTGQDLLEISSLILEQDLPVFSTSASTLRLEGGQEVALGLGFRPKQATSYSGHIVVESNASNTAVMRIDLRGSGAAAEDAGSADGGGSDGGTVTSDAGQDAGVDAGSSDCAATGGAEAVGFCWFLSPYVNLCEDARSCDEACAAKGLQCDLAGFDSIVNDQSRFLSVSSGLGKGTSYVWISNVEAAAPYGLFDRTPPYAYWKSRQFGMAPDCSARACTQGVQRFCACK